MNRIINWSLQNRPLVIGLALLIVVGGVWSMFHLAVDAFPETTPVLVQVNTTGSALGPVEMEQQVTVPLERSLAGIPLLQDVRSVTKGGLSQVTVQFEDGADIYRARQMVQDRVSSVAMPQGAQAPELGPITSGMGEIVHYILESKTRSLAELTDLQDWTIRPQLLSVPGVAEVNTWGGLRKQYQVQPDPTRLAQYHLTLNDVIEALQRSNLSIGGGYITHAGELQIVRGSSLLTSREAIAGMAIRSSGGIPIRVRDVAQVREGHELRRGGVIANGQGEVVHGLVFSLLGESTHDVNKRVAARLNDISSVLPAEVKLKVVYERMELLDQVIGTIKKNLLEGALLVVAVLFVFLGNLRAGLLVALAIPISMLFAFSAMLRFGIAASLLSLGAIDFGLVVDSSVIVVENCMRRLGQRPGESKLEAVRDATMEVRAPTMFGELIIMIVYVPILLLEGIEGRLFRPMAWTVIFALTGSLIQSLTLTPVLSSFFLPRQEKHGDNFLLRGVQRLAQPLVRFALRFRLTVLTTAFALVLGGAFLSTQLGAEFVPRLSEMAIVVNTVRLSGVSLEESIRYGTRIEQLIRESFPDEVRDIWSRTGTADVATDPMGMEVTDSFITLRPREQWKRAKSQAELTALIRAKLTVLPGMTVAFTQPIEMRLNEITAGLRADLGVKIVGPDLALLQEKAEEVEAILKSIPGSADVSIEPMTDVPVLDISVDQEAAGRYGVPPATVMQAVEAVAGISAGQIREGEKRFGLAVRWPESLRRDGASLASMPLLLPQGERIPLGQVTIIQDTEGPASISREWQSRRGLVQCNVQGRDLGGFVAEARRRIQKELTLPAGYHVAYGGQYEHLIRASQRMAIIVPLALGAILLLLYLSTRSAIDTLIVFTGAPLAALGGVIALFLRDMPFTISASVGFVAVSGVSVLNGLVLVSTIRARRAAGMELHAAIEQTRMIRLRPILMTALVASLGFLPMALNTSIGAEVQRPLATVVIGGVIADNVLTLAVLPALYSLAWSRQNKPLRESTSLVAPAFAHM